MIYAFKVYYLKFYLKRNPLVLLISTDWCIFYKAEVLSAKYHDLSRYKQKEFMTMIVFRFLHKLMYFDQISYALPS